jgi:hypothetical protein
MHREIHSILSPADTWIMEYFTELIRLICDLTSAGLRSFVFGVWVQMRMRLRSPAVLLSTFRNSLDWGKLQRNYSFFVVICERMPCKTTMLQFDFHAVFKKLRETQQIS